MREMLTVMTENILSGNDQVEPDSKTTDDILLIRKLSAGMDFVDLYIVTWIPDLWLQASSKEAHKEQDEMSLINL